MIITESVIDAAALWSAGIRNVIPIYGTTGLTEEMTAHLQQCRVRRAVLMMDSDEAGRAAAVEIAAKLQESSIEARSVEVPAKDPSEFIAQGGTADDVRALIAANGAAAKAAAKREQHAGAGQELVVRPSGGSSYDEDHKRTSEHIEASEDSQASEHELTNSPPEGRTTNNVPQCEIRNPQSNDGSINFTIDGRVYRVRGLSPSGLDRLRVNVRITVGCRS